MYISYKHYYLVSLVAVEKEQNKFIYLLFIYLSRVSL